MDGSQLSREARFDRQREIRDSVARQSRRHMMHADQLFLDSLKDWGDMLLDEARARRVIRSDTDTALFARSLTNILTRQFDRRYPGLMARALMPQGEPINPGAETVTAQGHEILGEATISRDYDTEVRRVHLSGSENPTPLYPIRSEWYLGWQQARAAAMGMVDLNGKGLIAARRVVDFKLDEVLSIGYTTGAGATILNGLVHPPAVVALRGGVWSTSVGGWGAAATAAQIINDVALLNNQVEASNLYVATDLVLAPLEWDRMKSLPVGIVANKTVMEWIRDIYGYNITRWNRLTNIPAGFAVAGAAVNRALLFEKSLEIVEPIVSVEIENLPSAWDGGGWSTQVHCRTGGVHCENPLGFMPFDMS